MNPFEAKNAAIIVVNNDNLHFVLLDRPGEWVLLDHPIPIEQIMNEPDEINVVPEKVRQRRAPLIIVPDYWVGNVGYGFQSRKRTLAETFIERKLLSENPELADIKHFYEYEFYQLNPRERGVFVHFLKEPNAFKLYNQLADRDLSPYQITTPALLWEQVLRNAYADFGDGGKALVHLLPSMAFLYFYSSGHFLFSRQIVLPEPDNDLSEMFKVLNYEVGQSLYLFSQQAKTEIEQFLLFSSGSESAESISAGFEREMLDIREKVDIKQASNRFVQEIGPVAPFSELAQNALKGFQSVSHRTVKKTAEWKQVQIAGIAVGLILILILGGEGFFLKKRLQHSQIQLSAAMQSNRSDQIPGLEQYNESLDFILRSTERPSVQTVIVHLAESLPDNMRIENLDVEVEPDPHVALEGAVHASGPDEFRESLSVFLEKLKNYFQGSRSLRIQEIDLEKGMSKVTSGHQSNQTYLFKLRFDLS